MTRPWMIVPPEGRPVREAISAAIAAADLLFSHEDGSHSLVYRHLVPAVIQ